MSRRDSCRAAGAFAIAAVVALFRPQAVIAQPGQRRTFALNVKSGRVTASNRTIKVREGDRVELRWIADEALALHLHGYDVRLNLKAGENGTMTFEAHATGRYPVAVHRSGSHHDSPVLYLEVHPQ